MQNNFSLEDLKGQRQDIQKAMDLPGIPEAEMAIYKGTLDKINQLIAQKTTPASQPIERNGVRTYQGVGSVPVSSDLRQPPPSRTIHAGNMAPQKGDMSSSIEASNQSEAHNPSVTISYSDGYEITVTEAEASSRFKTTLRDSAALKCVSENRLDKMWRWDTPWRCVGFYQALTRFWGTPPSLQQLGISRPSDATKAVFALVAEKSEKTQLV